LIDHEQHGPASFLYIGCVSFGVEISILSIEFGLKLVSDNLELSAWFDGPRLA